MDIVEQMRSFESDHEPDGRPAVTMGQVSALCDEVERLRAVIDAANQSPHITEQDALEIAKSVQSFVAILGSDYSETWLNQVGRTLLAKLNEAKHD